MSLYLTRQFSFYRIHLNIPETSKYADPFPCMLFIGSFPAHILEWKRSCPPLFFSRQFIDPCHEGIRPRPLQQNRYDTLAAFKDDFISPLTKSLSIIVEPFSATVRLSIFCFCPTRRQCCQGCMPSLFTALDFCLVVFFGLTTWHSFLTHKTV